jgi:hypothetical protein
MESHKVLICIEALASLNMALSRHDHIWTDNERKIYKKAIKVLDEEYTNAMHQTP